MMHEQVKVPVVKNIIYAIKLIWQADKKLFLGYILNLTAERVFSLFVQNIFFLKILLTTIEGGTFQQYIENLFMFLAVSIVLKVFKWYGNHVKQAATKNVLKQINNKVFQKAVELDVSCYENPEFYDKYQRATLVLAHSYFDLICYCVAAIFSSILSLSLVIGTVSSIDPKYLVFLVPVVFVFIIEISASKQIYKRDKEMTTNNRIKAYVQRTVFLKEYSKDMRTSNIFSVLMVRFKAAIDANVVILRKYGPLLFTYAMISSLFSEFIPVIGTYAFAAYQFIFTDALTVSGFSVVLSSVNSVKDATFEVTASFQELSQMAMYFQNLRDYFEYEPEILSGEEVPGEFQTLEFRNVTFRYPGAKKDSIKDVSFKLSKGETLALVGVNGAGKSTLVKLLLRFYDPCEGEILYNGVNIKKYDVVAYRECFGAVFQDYKNFAISVFENIMCHECSKEEKEKAVIALKQSGIWERISKMPSGGDTVITREFEKDGVGLSGGESQKLSVARLFAKEFEIAILDEPSSALDPIAEYKMYENLIEITKDKTVIYISHRLSSAVLSDRIIVLGDGGILQMGTHAELMSEEGEYKTMFTLQASSYNDRKAGDDVEED